MAKPELIYQLSNLISKKIDTVDASAYSLEELEELIELDMDTYDTNGWQVDFWIDGTYEGVILSISGSLWYRKCTISRRDN